jgi:hypothetical protein
VVDFAMQYPTAGLGMAKVFFDLPSTDNGDQANDPYLAAQIAFAIDPATAVGTGTARPAGAASASPASLLHYWPVTRSLPYGSVLLPYTKETWYGEGLL